MMKRHVLWPVLAATLALAACGGGSGDSPPPIQENPPPPPPAMPVIDRIEALDTTLLKSGAAANAEPAAISRMPAEATAARVTLGPLVETKSATTKNGLLLIGQGRAVAATASTDDLAAKLRWNALSDGAQVAAVEFSAAGARAIRLGVLVRQLPAGAVLRFYGVGGDQVVEMSAAQVDDLRQTNEAAGLTGDAARMVWGPDTAGSVSTLEVQIPAGAAASQVQLAVPLLSHLTQTVEQASQPAGGGMLKFGDLSDIGASDSRNLDVMCEVPVPIETRAVTKLQFIVEGGGTALCSGTLMNDSLGSRTPYVLTASHCIPGQTEASSLLTYWFFRSSRCNSSPLADVMLTRVTGGARLLQAEPSVDNALLQLKSQPPNQVVYAGSYFGYDTLPNPAVPNVTVPISIAPTVAVFGIHHPNGDLQKFSSGPIANYATCGGVGPDGEMACVPSLSIEGSTDYQVNWTRGLTQPGSSGSALFVTASGSNRHYVIGALSAGADITSFYGRFDQAFYHGFKDWLAPNK